MNPLNAVKRAIKKLFASTLRFVELDDENSYPEDKKFVYPNALIQCVAIEKYALSNKIPFIFLSKEKPITVKLGKDVYEAELTRRHLRTQGYYIVLHKMQEQ
ncbi:MAG: DUF4318 domain-containing protein [Gemmiger sp.]|nr:DUF4318 domain-containing protein [Gemmiger sp.]